MGRSASRLYQRRGISDSSSRILVGSVMAISPVPADSAPDPNATRAARVPLRSPRPPPMVIVIGKSRETPYESDHDHGVWTAATRIVASAGCSRSEELRSAGRCRRRCPDSGDRVEPTRPADPSSAGPLAAGPPGRRRIALWAVDRFPTAPRRPRLWRSTCRAESPQCRCTARAAGDRGSSRDHRSARATPARDGIRPCPSRHATSSEGHPSGTPQYERISNGGRRGVRHEPARRRARVGV